MAILVANRLFIIAACLGILFDIVSGFLLAVKNGTVSSEKMRLGLWHKSGFIGLIVLAIYLQWVQGIADISTYLPFELPTVFAVCTYIVMTEVISILENLKGFTPEIEKIITTVDKLEDLDIAEKKRLMREKEEDE